MSVQRSEDIFILDLHEEQRKTATWPGESPVAWFKHIYGNRFKFTYFYIIFVILMYAHL